MNKAMLKWTPAVPLPNKDNIISSGAKANNEKGFIPTYETEGRPNMYCLLNNEYMRIWFRERGLYEKEVYTKKEMMKEESKIKRRFVQKDLIRKEKKKTMPVIKLKRFQNIASKTDNHQNGKSVKEENASTIEEKESEKELNEEEIREEKIITERTESKPTTPISGGEPVAGEEPNQVREADEVEMSEIPKARCKGCLSRK